MLDAFEAEDGKIKARCKETATGNDRPPVRPHRLRPCLACGIGCPITRLFGPVVRSSHWGIASVVLLNALLTGGGSVVHVSLVRAARALLLRWLVRRVPAPTEARFSAFMPNPVTALGHVFDLAFGKARAYPLHNLTRQRLHLVTCLP